MNRSFAARLISTVGHPLVVVPVAAVVATLLRGGSSHSVVAVSAALLVVAGAVAVFAFLRVRSGRWVHADASIPRERRELNAFLLGLLPACALALWAVGLPLGLALGVGLSAALVLVAQLTRRWFKVSLHCAFAVFASTLLWPQWWLLLAFTALAALVAWSRLELGRHSVAEVVCGCVSGAVVGAVFHVVLAASRSP